MTQKRLSAADHRRNQLVDMTEAQLQNDLLELAKRRKWLAYHPHDSRRSTPGFPDVTLARRGRLVVAELKAVTGVWGEGQKEWLAAMVGDSPEEWHFGRTVHAGPAFHEERLIVACWTPLSWDEICEVLL